jgi:uroporphyrinogen-III synthase
MGIQDKCIVVTRAAHQQYEFLQSLKLRGAKPVSYPCIDISPPEDVTAIDSALNELITRKNVWLILSSQNSVYSLKKRVEAHGIAPFALSHVKVMAVGTKTLEAAKHAFHGQSALIPKHFSQAAMTPMLTALNNQHVVLLHGNLSDDAFYHEIQSHAATVTQALAYVTRKVRPVDPLAERLAAGNIDAVTFTCPSSVRACLENLIDEGYAFKNKLGATIACIGTSTASEVKRLGLNADVTASTHTLDGLLDALEAYYT